MKKNNSSFQKDYLLYFLNLAIEHNRVDMHSLFCSMNVAHIMDVYRKTCL